MDAFSKVGKFVQDSGSDIGGSGVCPSAVETIIMIGGGPIRLINSLECLQSVLGLGRRAVGYAGTIR